MCRDVEDITTNIRRMVLDQVFIKVLKETKNIFNKHFNKYKLNNINKFKNLIIKSNTIQTNSTNKWLYNFTDIQLPDNVNTILSLGPQFSIPITKKQIPVANIIKDTEVCIKHFDINEDLQNELRCKLTNIITNYIHKYNPKKESRFFLKQLNETKQFIKSNDHIIISRSDKGNATVIMYKDEYQNFMHNMLNDSSLYSVLKNDPTNKFQRLANDLINELFDLEVINEHTKKSLKKYNSVPPLLYGLRKTHKNILALRPVVSCINSPTYNLAKFIHNILMPVASTFKFSIKNSHQCISNIEEIKLPKNYILISLDVVSLFTNIPKMLVITIIKTKWQFLKAYTDVPLKTLVKLIEFCFNSSYFKFEDKFYSQLDGSAMGNPSSPILAEFVMDYIIGESLKKINVPIPFIQYYVDDTILAVPYYKVDEIVNIFNSIHPKIQFTVEQETNNSIPFLDLLLIRCDGGKIISNWYSKPTSSGRTLNFLSNHSMTQKLNIISSLVYKCTTLSDKSFHKDNLVKIQNQLIQNNYPKNLVHKCINKYYNKYMNNHNNSYNNTSRCESEENLYVSFPFLPGLSHNVNNILKKFNIKPAFYPVKKLNCIFTRLKDKVQKDKVSNIVYKINCSNCEKCYIGQTKQYVSTRLYQHKNECNDRNKHKKEQTALTKHHFENKHNFDFVNFEILDYESNYNKRILSEMIWIKKNKLCVNNRSDVENLSNVYANLIEML